MDTTANYASMMDLEEPIVRYFLFGLKPSTEEEIINKLLELKHLIEPLDPVVAHEVIISKSGNQEGTLECLRKLNEVHSETEKHHHKSSHSGKHKERGILAWFFGTKTKNSSASSSRDIPNNEHVEEEKVQVPKSSEEPPKTIGEVKPSKEVKSSAEVKNVTLSPKEKEAPKFRKFFAPTRLFPEEEQLSRQYNFASTTVTAPVVDTEPGEEFEAIFKQFVKTVSPP